MLNLQLFALGGFRLCRVVYTPLEGPLKSPNRLVFPLPENTRRIDFGFPPPSHNHLIEQVPTSNDELPRPQAKGDDFGKVLRKEHAGPAANLNQGTQFTLLNQSLMRILNLAAVQR